MSVQILNHTLLEYSSVPLSRGAERDPEDALVYYIEILFRSNNECFPSSGMCTRALDKLKQMRAHQGSLEGRSSIIVFHNFYSIGGYTPRNLKKRQISFYLFNFFYVWCGCVNLSLVTFTQCHKNIIYFIYETHALIIF